MIIHDYIIAITLTNLDGINQYPRLAGFLIGRDYLIQVAPAEQHGKRLLRARPYFIPWVSFECRHAHLCYLSELRRPRRIQCFTQRDREVDRKLAVIRQLRYKLEIPSALVVHGIDEYQHRPYATAKAGAYVFVDAKGRGAIAWAPDEIFRRLEFYLAPGLTRSRYLSARKAILFGPEPLLKQPQVREDLHYLASAHIAVGIELSRCAWHGEERAEPGRMPRSPQCDFKRLGIAR